MNSCGDNIDKYKKESGEKITIGEIESVRDSLDPCCCDNSTENDVKAEGEKIHVGEPNEQQPVSTHHDADHKDPKDVMNTFDPTTDEFGGMAVHLKQKLREQSGRILYD